MTTVIAILLAMTAVSGIVDAVCFIALGHVFTANMTGNVVFLGFAIGGVPGLSIWRSLLALVFFMSGALLGGRMTKAMNPQDPGSTPVHALVIETLLLLAASVVSIGFRAPYEDHKLKIVLVIALTAVVMGLRNAVVRKLGVPDLTTTVLTMTIAGLAADARLAGGQGSHSGRRLVSIGAMLIGALVGAALVLHTRSIYALLIAVVAMACVALASRFASVP